MYFVMIPILVCVGISAVRGGSYFSRGSIIGLNRGTEIGRGYQRQAERNARSYIIGSLRLENSERAKSENSQRRTSIDYSGSYSGAPADLKQLQIIRVEGPSRGEAKLSIGFRDLEALLNREGPKSSQENEASGGAKAEDSQKSASFSYTGSYGVPVDLTKEQVIRVGGPSRGEAKISIGFKELEALLNREEPEASEKKEVSEEANTEGSQSTESSSEAPVDVKEEKVVRVEGPSRGEAKLSVEFYRELEALLNREGLERSQKNEASNSLEQLLEQNQLNGEQSSSTKTESKGLNNDLGGSKSNSAERTENNRKSDQNEVKARSAIGFSGIPVDIKREEIVSLKAEPKYHYDYRVADFKTKDYKSKSELRDGSKVRGTYSLLEPDLKTVRVVDYTSDKDQGFIAKVSYRKNNNY